jgi:hypothetical protein
MTSYLLSFQKLLKLKKERSYNFSDFSLCIISNFRFLAMESQKKIFEKILIYSGSQKKYLQHDQITGSWLRKLFKK